MSEEHTHVTPLPGHLLTEEDVAGYSPVADPLRTVEFACVLRAVQEDLLEKGMAEGRPPLSRERLEQDFSWNGSLKRRAVYWLTRHGVQLVREDAFVLWLKGSMDEISQTLHTHFIEKNSQFMLAQEPEVPPWLAAGVVGFVGLENISRLYPHFRAPKREDLLANDGQGFFPADLQQACGFPQSVQGDGVTIGLLEFSNGYSQTDVEKFWQEFGINPPSLQFVSVDGTPNDGGVNPWDMEATLDVEWSGAMAPGADLVVYESSAGANDSSFALSVLRALQFAYNDSENNPDILSISYGDGETRFPVATMKAWDTVARNCSAIGMTVFVASGDEGAYGLHGPGRPICHVDAPANCPHVTACGGTSLIVATGNAIAEETGWTDVNNNGASGGGISQVFPMPAYQDNVVLPIKSGYHRGRGVPDVAFNANPDTGYAVFFQGSWTVVGGTSASSPVWAALLARFSDLRAEAGLPLIGALNPRLYTLGPTDSFRPITVGNNSYAGVVGYECTPGWNAVTGWGSPHAMILGARLSS